MRDRVRDSEIAFRLATGLMGVLSIGAVLLAVEQLGWWAVLPGVFAGGPGLLFVLVGVLGDEEPAAAASGGDRG